MINHLVYNNDVYLDVLAVNDHDHIEGADLFVYWGSNRSSQSLMPPLADQLPRFKSLNEIERRQTAALRLPSDAGGRSILADLNGDAYEEIIFCNFKHNTIYSKALIYWNSPTGFEVIRRTLIPSVTARDCAVGDINNDTYADLLLVNNDRKEKSVYLYWGGPDGLSADQQIDWKSVDPISATLADLDGDEILDLVLLHKNDQLELF